MERPTERHEALRQRVSAGRERQSAKQRRSAVARKGGRRVIAIGAGLAMIAGVLTVTQLASSALEDNEAGLGANEPCQEVREEVSTNELEVHIEEDEDGTEHRHYRRRGGNNPPPPPAETPGECEDEGTGGEGEGEGTGGEGEGEGEGTGGEGEGEGTGEGEGEGEGEGTPNSGTNPGGIDGTNNGLDILGRNCEDSDLPLHTGFQTEEATCVNAHMGEAAALDNNPSLLITDAPEWVEIGQDFTITVSTRNLVRDRFLGAAAGGYYLESGFLNEDGIIRGHFHLACVNLIDGAVAPEINTLLSPQHFVAVEDGGGGAGADFVTVEVPGLPTEGLYRCMAWAGDGSHRVPMTSFARIQIPVDTVRITVTEVGEGEG